MKCIKKPNLADHGVRKYDNTLGQFTSIDPLWEKYYGWTPYHYCQNNPMMAVDPSGFAKYYIAQFDKEGNANINNDTKFVDDGVDDGKVYLTDEGTYENSLKYADDVNGPPTIDYEILKSGILLPNSQIRDALLANHESHIKGEAASVGGFDFIFFGGRNSIGSCTDSQNSDPQASVEVQRASNMARDGNKQSLVRWFAHDHTFDCNENPGPDDKNSLGKHRDLTFQFGILFNRENVSIFYFKDQTIKMSRDMFKNIGK